MTEAEAAIVLRTMIRTMALLNESVLDLQPRMDASTFAAYKAQIAKLMGDMAVDVLENIYAQFPHLEPRDQEQWRQAGGLFEPHWLTPRP